MILRRPLHALLTTRTSEQKWNITTAAGSAWHFSLRAAFNVYTPAGDVAFPSLPPPFIIQRLLRYYLTIESREGGGGSSCFACQSRRPLAIRSWRGGVRFPQGAMVVNGQVLRFFNFSRKRHKKQSLIFVILSTAPIRVDTPCMFRYPEPAEQTSTMLPPSPSSRSQVPRF